MEKLAPFRTAGKETGMLEFQKFVQEIRNKLQMTLGETYEIVIESMGGFNQVNQTLLSIKWDTVSESPSIHLERYYEQYLNELVTLEDILDHELYLLEVTKREKIPLHSHWEDDYGSIKKKLHMMLVNYQANTELLNQHPYIPMLDLAVIFFIESFNNSMEFIKLVNYSRMKAWGVDAQQLYQDAYDNMRNLQHINISSLSEELGKYDPFPFLTEFLGNEDENLIIPDSAGGELLWCMNIGPFYGAAAMLYEEKLHDFAMEHQGNIFILPSSVHEVLLAVDDGDITAAELAESVRCVNCMELRQEDLLSNSVYYYDRLERKISVAESGELVLPFMKRGPMS